MTWLLLLHQVPPSPPYLRAKVLRRLKQVGALPLKKSAYLLPNTDDTLEDFQWILKEIKSDGGEGWLLAVEALAGLSDESIQRQFRDLRAEDYRELLAEIRDSGDLPKLRKRFGDIVKIDFFQAPGKEEVAAMLRQVESGGAEGATSEFVGRRWVTRRGIKVDRSACCWLILRFLDPAAEIAFVDPAKYTHREGEIRFDMFEGEITHEGGLCSFEVLARKAGLADRGITAVGEIVHDLDLKDEKYRREENAGVAAMLDGIAARHTDDRRRMEEALVLFDALYATAR